MSPRNTPTPELFCSLIRFLINKRRASRKTKITRLKERGGAMSYLPRFLFNICKDKVTPEQEAGTMSVIIQRPYAYLKAQLRRAFEREGDVNVIVDRRHRERRASRQLFAAERRRVDRRTSKEQLVEVILFA
jgi:hypothetical protein